MNKYYKLLTVLVLINFAYSEMSLDLYTLHPDYPDKCFDRIDEHLYSPGEDYKPIGRCMTLTCLGPGKIRGRSCGKALLIRCKSTGYDYRKPHPQCCPRYLCKAENGTKYIREYIVSQTMELSFAYDKIII